MMGLSDYAAAESHITLKGDDEEDEHTSGSENEESENGQEGEA